LKTSSNMRVFYLLKPCFLMLVLLTSITVQAQTGSLSGTVLDETGQPLPGASIQIKNSSRSTTTEVTGKYSLTGLSNGPAIVVVSYIGYQTAEKPVTVNGNTTLNVSLAQDLQNLSEVVVIGYGSVQKKDL